MSKLMKSYCQKYKYDLSSFKLCHAGPKPGHHLVSDKIGEGKHLVKTLGFIWHQIRSTLYKALPSKNQLLVSDAKEENVPNSRESKRI